MPGNTVAESIDSALLNALQGDEESSTQPYLGYYFVSEDVMSKLEEGVDVKEMNRLLAFLSDGLKKRTSVHKPRLELVFDDDDFPPSAGDERAAAREVTAPLALDWEDFSGLERPKSDVKEIMHGVREETDDAVTPVVNLDAHGDAITPSLALEVEDKFTLKQRLLYSDLPEETYLLLSIGADVDALLQAAEKFKTRHPEISRDAFVALCAQIFLGYGVRFYSQFVQRGPVDDSMSRVVGEDVRKVQELVTAGTFTSADIEAHLAALFLVHEKMRRDDRYIDHVYTQFIQSDLLKDVA